MYNYICGKVTILESNLIVLENSGIGYNIFVPNPYSYEEGSEVTIYLYNQIREDENSLYGFKTKEERDLFLRLLNVKGLGPKVGMGFFATGSVGGIVDAIERENVLYLKKFPKVGEKLARQIVLDLKGKLGDVEVGNSAGDDSFELVSVLESLGYNSKDINRILPNVDKTNSIENQVKEALKLLLK
ncbi:MAG TPA: Holliday junction branch migration protein RuvA [Firmicutes bacterium]|nr:Holliday junction branch migration protein RuvA [Bacillota bacterium]